jgi:iron(III) transport system permease protein
LTFDFQSTPGFVFIMSLGLLPYVYFLSRISFESYGRVFLELGQSLGLSTALSFFKILSPFALPAVALGAALVFIETAGEWATAKMLSVNTGATAVHELWFARDAKSLASQLAFLLMTAALVAVVPLTRSAGVQSARHFSAMPAGPPRAAGTKEAPHAKWLRFLLCFAPGLLGFIIPAAAVLYYFVGTVGKIDLSELLTNSVNSVVLLLAVLSITGVFALILSATHRYSPNFFSGFVLRWLTVSYAVPAMVLAVGVLMLLDQELVFEERYSDVFSFLVLAVTLSIRFACFLFIPLYIGLKFVSKQVEDIAGSLGLAKTRGFFRLQLPLIWRFAMFGILLLSLQVIKETSISVALHPFSFQTLVLKTYAYIDIGLLPESSAWIIATVLLGLYPLLTIEGMILSRRGSRS